MKEQLEEEGVVFKQKIPSNHSISVTHPISLLNAPHVIHRYTYQILLAMAYHSNFCLSMRN